MSSTTKPATATAQATITTRSAADTPSLYFKLTGDDSFSQGLPPGSPPPGHLPNGHLVAEETMLDTREPRAGGRSTKRGTSREGTSR
jgi:hypothetical protein